MKKIEGVPESITREQYLDLMRAAGFEPDDLYSLTFRPDGIYATALPRDPETGKRIPRTETLTDEEAVKAIAEMVGVMGGTQAIKHTIYIPVKD